MNARAIISNVWRKGTELFRKSTVKLSWASSQFQLSAILSRSNLIEIKKVTSFNMTIHIHIAEVFLIAFSSIFFFVFLSSVLDDKKIQVGEEICLLRDLSEE